ncbi:MAG: hypothetical protein ACKV2T_18035 [Kofleriaceae bacterium]
MNRLAVVLVVGACSKDLVKPEPEPARPSEPAVALPTPLPAHYGSLFEDGRRWNLHMSGKDMSGEPICGLVRCTAKVDHLGALHISKIRCDPKADLDGIYVGTPRGLWRATFRADERMEKPIEQIVKEEPMISAIAKTGEDRCMRWDPFEGGAHEMCLDEQGIWLYTITPYGDGDEPSSDQVEYEIIR